MSLLRSFGYAIQGVWHCINHERNMRIHIVAALYVLVFSLFFQLSAAEYGVLFVLIGLVMALELVNTALEAAGNAITKEKNRQIKILKDTAAGAVFVFALTAVAVGLVIFWKPQGFLNLYTFFAGQPLWLIPVGIGTILCVIFIYRSPVQIAEYFKK